MEQFLYRIKPARPEMLTDGPTDRETAIINEHFAYLEALVTQGIVIIAGRTLVTDERSFGIVILTAETEFEAMRIMDNDPAVKAGVMRAELFPFRLSLWSNKTLKID